MEEILKALGLSLDSNAAQAIMRVKEIMSSQADLRDTAAAMTKLVTELEEQILTFSKNVQDVRVEAMVRQVQNESGRFLGKESLPKLEAKAKKYVVASTEEDRNSLMEDMKTICVAHGVNMTLRKELSGASESERDEDDDTGELDKKVSKIMKIDKNMSFEAATRIALNEEKFSKFILENKGAK